MFWDNVKKEVEYQGISYKEIADKTGLLLQSIYNGMSRQTSPSVEVAYKIATVLNVSVEYLVTGKDKTIPKDIQEDVNLLNTLTEEQRKPINILIKGQVDYWKNIK